MKSLIVQTRLYIAELILGIVIDVARKEEEGMKLIVHIGSYFGGKIAEKINKKT